MKKCICHKNVTESIVFDDGETVNVDMFKRGKLYSYVVSNNGKSPINVFTNGFDKWFDGDFKRYFTPIEEHRNNIIEEVLK
jgi:hypothetical protein